MFSHGVTVTIERPGGTDRYGNTLPGTSHIVEGCAVAPRSSEERTDGQATVITGRSLYAPAGADITAGDAVVLNGAPQDDDERWQVNGDPAEWVNPFTGWSPGTAVALTRAEG